jgi:hypothetical protein
VPLSSFLHLPVFPTSIRTLLVGPLAAFRARGRGPFTRTGHGQLPASSDQLFGLYRTCALAAAARAGFLAAAAIAEGSAKAITASPSVLIVAGLPPKG